MMDSSTVSSPSKQTQASPMSRIALSFPKTSFDDEDVAPASPTSIENMTKTNENNSEIVLAVWIEKDKIGAASYDSNSANLNMTQIPTWNDDMDLTLTHLKLHVNPSLLLLSPKITSGQLECLRVSALDEEKEIPFRVLKTSLFSYVELDPHPLTHTHTNTRTQIQQRS